MEDFAVAHTLRKKTLRRGQRDTVGAPQHPPTVFLTVVGESGTCSGSATSMRRCGALMVTRARPMLMDRPSPSRAAEEIEDDEAADASRLYLP
jgi:hypothetical protein